MKSEPTPDRGKASTFGLMTVGMLAALVLVLPIVAISVAILLLLLGVWSWPFG